MIPGMLDREDFLQYIYRNISRKGALPMTGRRLVSILPANIEEDVRVFVVSDPRRREA
jgi:hypothetical protein